MTDTSSLATTQSTANVLPVTTASPRDSPVLPNGNASQSAQDDEEEPYTIKCICTFVDDDGNTVLCESCETWQHILCYYVDSNDVPDVHNCVDCEPRPLDRKRAIERQRRQREREQSEASDRKGRRSGSKAQKKKASKDAVDGPNGWPSHQRSGSNSTTARDYPPPAKKAKHRQSASVSSAIGSTPLLPPPEKNRKRATSASTSASPTKPSSLLPQIPLYSQEFLHLYDNDQANVDMQSNLFDTIGFTGDLASWVQNPDALARVSNGRTLQDVFTLLDHPLDSTKWPVISRQSKTDKSIEIDGIHPTWQFVKVESDVRKDEIVGEVKGKIGHLHNYCLDPSSRWQELRHPEPFVFFHPQLPVYIDSRKEGTQLRYIRRSCLPNVTMKTFITNEVEYHFCFVANQDIPAQSEITATWYLDAQLFPSNNGDMKPDGANFTIPDSAAVLISNVLANFGGCACNSQGCPLAKLDLRRAPKNNPDSGAKQVNGKRRKSKKQVPSPISTGRATNSRAGSESAQVKDDDDPAGSRSSSASLRDNNPRSRDRSPSPNNPNLNPSTTTELSAREKRKIAAAEKNFERLEQDQHVQKRRKKSTLTNPPRLDTAQSRRSSGSPRKQSPKSTTSRRGSHSSTARKVSGPNTPIVGSPLAANPRYVDREMQTEPDENDPRFEPPKTATSSMRRHVFVPLTQRLLRRCHEDRLKLAEAKRFAESPTQHGAMGPPSSSIMATSPTQKLGDQDVEMKDADTSITPTKSQQSPASVRSGGTVSPTEAPFKTPPHPWPSSLAHHIPLPSSPSHLNGTRPGGVGNRGPLRVQLPPTQISPPTTQQTQTPGTMTPSISQSPFAFKSGTSQPATTPGAGVAAPSPVKKKLSLGDYMSRRGTLATPTMEKPPPLVPSQTQTSPQGQPSQSASAGSPEASSLRPSGGSAKGAAGEGEVKKESPPPPQEDVNMDEAPYSPPEPSPVSVPLPPPPAPNADASHQQQQPSPSTMSRDPRLQHR